MSVATTRRIARAPDPSGRRPAPGAGRPTEATGQADPDRQRPHCSPVGRPPDAPEPIASRPSCLGTLGARAWRRPAGGSILPGTTRIPAKFTVPGPSGHEIGQLADVMTRRTRDCSPDAMGVVPKRGRTTPVAIFARGPAAHPDQGSGTAAGPAGKYQRRPHISATLPMIREMESLTMEPKDRPRTPTSARDTTRLIRARARPGPWEVSDETYPHRATEGPERAPVA